MTAPVKQKDIELFEKVQNVMKGGETMPMEQVMAECKKNKNILKWQDKEGYTCMARAIESQRGADLIGQLLAVDKECSRTKIRQRLPLHVALEQNPKDDVIMKLIDSFPGSLQVQDSSVDGRLPLHMILESHPFPASFVELGMKVLQKYKDAASVRSHDKLPLMVCLEQGLQPRLTTKVLEAYRCAACVATKEGKLPLHVAIENNLEPRVVILLLEANPAALMAKMTLSGVDMSPLEQTIRNKRSDTLIEALMNGGPPGGESNPKCVAYARAAAIGRLTKESHQLDDSSRRQVANASGRRAEFEASNDREALVAARRRIEFSVKPFAGEQMVLEMCPEEKVETLKHHIQEREGTLVDRMRLSMDGKQMMDGFHLGHYRVHKGCVVHMQPRFEILQQALRHGAPSKITLHLLKLRPQAANEDDRNGVLPLQLALQNKAQTEVVIAVLKEHREAVKVPLRGGAIGEFPLHMALQKNYSPNVIRELLQDAEGRLDTKKADWKASGAYVPAADGVDVQCKMPLHLAISCGNGSDDSKQIIRILLESKCPIAVRDAVTGHSALDACLASDSVSNDLFGQIWHEIIKVNPKIAEQAGPNGQRPLHVAVVHKPKNQAIIEHLCVQGRDALEAFDVDGRLPIHLAVSNRAGFAVVRTLLFHCARSINRTDGQGRTPLQLAVTHKAEPGVVFEITRTDKQTLNVKDSRGRSLMELAVTSDAPQWVVQELLEASPGDAQNVNLLSGKWPNTKASSEALRFAFEARKRQANQQRGSALMGGQPSIANGGGQKALGASMPPQPSGDRNSQPNTPRGADEEEPSTLASVGKWFGW